MTVPDSHIVLRFQVIFTGVEFEHSSPVCSGEITKPLNMTGRAIFKGVFDFGECSQSIEMRVVV